MHPFNDTQDLDPMGYRRKAGPEAGLRPGPLVFEYCAERWLSTRSTFPPERR